MPITVSNVYVQTFEQTVRHLAQQSDTKLRGWVQERGVQSEQHNWETLDQTVAALKGGPRSPTPVTDGVWGRRVSVTRTYDVGDTTEQEDPIQMLIDPNSNLARSQGMAMRRAIDDEIIGAATAAALNGDGGTTALTAAQTVGDGNGEISFDIVTQVNEKFMENDIDPEVPKVFVVGPKQVRRMLQLTEVTSVDYQNVKALAGNGMVPNWMGFMWIMSNRLNVPGADELDCLAFTRAAIGLQVNRDITARVAEDPSLSFAWRIYCFMTIGAVRVEDRELVKVHLADTVT